MIVADTDVLSEPLRPRPEEQVLRWLERHHQELAITTVTIGELRYGARRLPAGQRRSALIEAIEQLVVAAGDRVLPYGAGAADAYGALRAVR